MRQRRAPFFIRQRQSDGINWLVQKYSDCGLGAIYMNMNLLTIKTFIQLPVPQSKT